jgi:hypothetical protein
MGLRSLACWDRGFQFRRGNGCLSLANVVCCQVEVPASGRSLVPRSPTECGVSEGDRETSTMRRSWPNRVCRAIKKNKMVTLNVLSIITGRLYITSMWYHFKYTEQKAPGNSQSHRTPPHQLWVFSFRLLHITLVASRILRWLLHF